MTDNKISSARGQPSSCVRFWFLLVQNLTRTKEYQTYSLPKGTCTVCLWFYTFRWSSDPEERNTVSHKNTSPVQQQRFFSVRPHLVFLTRVAIHLVHIWWTLQKTTTVKTSDTLWWMCVFGCWDLCDGSWSLTWLEFPVQFSGISQSFTASLHTTPMNSICSRKQCRTKDSHCFQIIIKEF